jgi:hypothetical protein
MSRRVLATGALALALTLGGCGSGSELDASSADALQSDVLALTVAARAEKWDVADARLTSTQAHLDAALEAGQVSQARYHQIDAALARVAALVADQRLTELRAEAAARATAAAKPSTAPSSSATETPAPGPTRATSSGPGGGSAEKEGKGKGPGPKHAPKPKKQGK